MQPDQISQLVRQDRRSVFPQFFTDRPVARNTIESLLADAEWAPNHARTEPWRWIVYQNDGRQELADEVIAAYRAGVAPEKQDDKKVDKTRKKIMQSPVVLVILLRRDPQERIPEWEEVAAVSMAVQNIWLGLAPRDLGGYWSSPGYLTRASAPLSRMESGERCLGLFYLGYHQAPDLERQRGGWNEKTRWVG